MKLLIIILVAIVLRFTSLSTIPIGFNDDEAAFGYNAYSILKTGKDEWGRTMPFPAFESFGDWKLVGYLYPTVIAEAIFGLSEFSTRMPSAVFGVLTVIATYLLTKKLFNEQTALLAGAFLAISPWHIIASRNAFESDLLSFFITLGTYFYLKALKDGRLFKYSLLLFLSSFYIYRSAWLFVPLFFLFISYRFRNDLKRIGKVFTKSALIGIIFLLPLVPTVLTFRGQSRFIQESFITGATRIGITNDINNSRGLCASHIPTTACSLIYNKYVFFTKTYVSNYFKNLSYDSFFSIASETGFQSFATRSVLYLFELPLLILGLFFLFKTKHHATGILIPWILIAPIGASITGIGNYGRLNLIMPAPQIIAAFGLYAAVKSIKHQVLRYAVVCFAVVAITFSVMKFAVDLFYQEPVVTSRYQRYGYKELFGYLKTQEGGYDHFYISKKIDNSHQYIQYLFHQKVDPGYFRANVTRSRALDGWVNMESIANYNFANSAPGTEQMPAKSLIVIAPKEVDYFIEPKFKINYLNGETGFEVYDADGIKAAKLNKK